MNKLVKGAKYQTRPSASYYYNTLGVPAGFQIRYRPRKGGKYILHELVIRKNSSPYWMAVDKLPSKKRSTRRSNRRSSKRSNRSNRRSSKRSNRRSSKRSRNKKPTRIMGKIDNPPYAFNNDLFDLSKYEFLPETEGGSDYRAVKTKITKKKITKKKTQKPKKQKPKIGSPPDDDDPTRKRLVRTDTGNAKLY